MKGWIGVMEEEDLEDKVKEEQIIDIEDHKKHQKKLEYRREYTKRPYVKAKRKAYNKLPGMKEKIKQYNKEYYQRRKKEKNNPISTKNIINGMYTECDIETMM